LRRACGRLEPMQHHKHQQAQRPTFGAVELVALEKAESLNVPGLKM
jgi:hypothetical protein